MEDETATKALGDAVAQAADAVLSLEKAAANLTRVMIELATTVQNDDDDHVD